MTNNLPFKAPHSYDYQEGRCLLCDARYCVDGCYADAPGAVYVVGTGWVSECTPADEIKALFRREFAMLALHLENGHDPEGYTVQNDLEALSALYALTGS